MALLKPRCKIYEKNEKKKYLMMIVVMMLMIIIIINNNINGWGSLTYQMWKV